jgi:hypothetical protein
VETGFAVVEYVGKGLQEELARELLEGFDWGKRESEGGRHGWWGGEGGWEGGGLGEVAGGVCAKRCDDGGSGSAVV